MANTSRAWVMDVGAGWQAAAGAPQVVEYLLAPETVAVPRAPIHCAGLMIWRDRMIPVIDLAPLLGERGAPQAPMRRAVILAYQEAPLEPLRYGALMVAAAPAETWVSDDMAGDLPEAPAAFRHIARACFVLRDRTIPVLDAKELFARPLPPVLAATHDARADDIRFAESAIAQRREPGEEPRGRSVAHEMPAWRASPIAEEPPASPPQASDHDVPGNDVTGTGEAVSEDCLVLPFAPAKPSGAQVAPPDSTSRTEADSVATAPSAAVPARAGLPAFRDEEMPAAAVPEGRADVELPRHGGMTTVAVAGAASFGTNMQRQPSGTRQSFQHLRPMERRSPRPRRRLRWQLLAVGMALVIAAVVRYVPAYLSEHQSPAKKAFAARDAAPGGINPVSVPSAPAQPPR